MSAVASCRSGGVWGLPVMKFTLTYTGKLPSSGGERRVLRLAASIAGGIPVSLYDDLPGLDQRNASLVINAVLHATGQKPISE